MIGAAGVNLNGDDDADITPSQVENYTASGADGNDVVSAAGGFGTGTALTLPSSLQGDQGDDEISSGLANDTIGGGTGTDTLRFPATTGGVTVSLAVTAAQNTGGAGTDTITGIRNVEGTTFDDTLTGDGTANVISGLDGDDRLSGGLGDDTLSGGSGSDTADYASSAAAVTVALDQVTQDTIGAGTDALSELENLTGGSAADALSGDGGPNSIRGLGGNDIVNGRGGDDGLDGGTGTDTVSLESAVSGTTIDLEAGLSTGDGTDSLASFESATGSSFNDVLIGTDLANILDGALGVDTVDYSRSIGGVSLNLQTNAVTGAGGTDTLAEIENAAGSVYDDVMVGNTRPNTLLGAGGDDTLNGAGADDALSGGEGIDTADYTTSGTNVHVDLRSGEGRGRGDDTLSGIENASSGIGNDVLRGTSGANTLDGGTGQDRIEGRGGDDDLDGGAGTDTVDFSSSTRRVRVNLVQQRATGAGTDALVAFEDVRGGRGADTLTGDGVANRIDGGPGNDVLRGRGGDDALIGGRGTDTVDCSGFAPVTEDKGIVVNLTRGRASGEGADDLSSVESVIGSGAGDHITGNRRANRLIGGPGRDTLIGGIRPRPAVRQCRERSPARSRPSPRPHQRRHGPRSSRGRPHRPPPLDRAPQTPPLTDAMYEQGAARRVVTTHAPHRGRRTRLETLRRPTLPAASRAATDRDTRSFRPLRSAFTVRRCGRRRTVRATPLRRRATVRVLTRRPPARPRRPTVPGSEVLTRTRR